MITGECKERILAIGAASLALAFIAVVAFAPTQTASQFPPISFVQYSFAQQVSPGFTQQVSPTDEQDIVLQYFQRAKWEGIERAERINEQLMRRYHERWSSGQHPTAPFQPALECEPSPITPSLPPIHQSINPLIR
jgi:hypothetical protein